MTRDEYRTGELHLASGESLMISGAARAQQDWISDETAVF